MGDFGVVDIKLANNNEGHLHDCRQSGTDYFAASLFKLHPENKTSFCVVWVVGIAKRKRGESLVFLSHHAIICIISRGCRYG